MRHTLTQIIAALAFVFVAGVICSGCFGMRMKDQDTADAYAKDIAGTSPITAMDSPPPGLVAGRAVLALPLAMVNGDLGFFPAKQYVPLADIHSNPDSGIARIIVLRPTSYGAGADFKVVVRRGEQVREIGMMPPKTSLCFDEQPGEMEISISAEGPRYTKFVLAGGMVHYLKFKPHLTWAGLAELNSDEGQKTLNSCLPPR